MSTPDINLSEETRIVNLVVELEAAKVEKKEAAKMHAENIKRIQEEIKELLKNLPAEPSE